MVNPVPPNDLAPAPPGQEAGPSDGSLLRRFRDGCQDAATLLYRRYAERLLALARVQCSPELARRVEPDEIVQSVFRTFFHKASQGLYDAPAGEDLWKLLLVIALHKIRTKGVFHAAARRDVRLTRGDVDLDRSPLKNRAPDEAALTFLQLVINEALEPLSPLSRAMIELRIAGHEVAEIAEKTGRARRSVERVLQAFRKKLADILDEDHEPT